MSAEEEAVAEFAFAVLVFVEEEAVVAVDVEEGDVGVALLVEVAADEAQEGLVGHLQPDHAAAGTETRARAAAFFLVAVEQTCPEAALARFLNELAQRLLLLQHHSEGAVLFQYFLSHFEDVAQYFCILVGAESEVELSAVEYEFAGVEGEGDGAYVRDGYCFFEGVVVEEVDAVGGDGEDVIGFIAGGVEVVDGDQVEHDLVGLHLFAHCLHLSRVH